MAISPAFRIIFAVIGAALSLMMAIAEARWRCCLSVRGETMGRRNGDSIWKERLK
jgi:hypothetical protein